MKLMYCLLTSCVLLMSSINVALAQAKTTYRDSAGRTTGSSTTDKSGKTTYRDSAGRTTGTATTNNQGKTTYRDPAGRTTGTSAKR